MLDADGVIIAKEESFVQVDGGERNVNGEPVADRSDGIVVGIGIVEVDGKEKVDDGGTGGNDGGSGDVIEDCATAALLLLAMSV